MIGVRVPFRVSFVGGGSDLPVFYRERPGAVVSTTIDKYMYVFVHPFFDNGIQVKYSRTERASRAEDIEHPIVREVLREFDLGPVDINSIADVPAGTGLGSSSAFTVAMLLAARSKQGSVVSKEWLAAKAAEVEMDRLQAPIGKQDAYASALGGINRIAFFPDESVRSEPLPIRSAVRMTLDAHLMMFYTGSARSAGELLAQQQEALAGGRGAAFERTSQLVSLVDPFSEALVDGKFSECGRILHEAWQLKRVLAQGISTDEIDRAYEAAIRCGAYGGKLLGAGGSGFLALLVPPESHESVRQAVRPLREFNAQTENGGAQLILNDS